MARKILIKNAQLVNEGRVFSSDVRICNERIEKISGSITPSGSEELVDASGFYLLPGMIDDQVHFRLVQLQLVVLRVLWKCLM